MQKHSQTKQRKGLDLWSFFLQDGGQVSSNDGTKSMFDSPAAKESFQYFLDLRNKLHVAPTETVDWKTIFSRFNDGSLAMFINGSWMIPGLHTSKISYDTAMIPQLFDKQYSAWADVHMFAFTRKDETKTK